MPSFSSLITLCFLSAFCSLSVQSAPSTTGHAVVGRLYTHNIPLMNFPIQGLYARQVQAPNPFGLGPFPPGSTALVTAVSHALFTQRLVVTGPPAPCTLQGSGEGVDMTVLGSDPTSPTPTQCTFEPATTADSLPLSVLFQFSSTGPNGVFNNTPIVKFSTHMIQNVISTTEDSTDNDENDTEATVTITVVLFPNSTAPAQSTVSTFEHSESGTLIATHWYSVVTGESD
ncbi:hypothetical protein GGX14DRAFT_387661 [Mycena pura]|uniref:Uncharacterized protein n=1 Tax=Mycena pura TaxID=153505 RepID=A0AAD6YMB0_9AGAR|nr:hypothetical protein GGX14DRAFT_387661 [Mycena pura]